MKTSCTRWFVSASRLPAINICVTLAIRSISEETRRAYPLVQLSASSGHPSAYNCQTGFPYNNASYMAVEQRELTQSQAPISWSNGRLVSVRINRGYGRYNDPSSFGC